MGTPNYRVVVPHGQPGISFGLIQNMSNGSLRAISPCCGDFMDGNTSDCHFCGGTWVWLAEKRNANTIGAFDFSHKDDEDYFLNDIVENWIQRLLGFSDNSPDCIVKVDWS